MDEFDKETEASQREIPDVDVFIRRDIHYINGISEEECTEQSLNSSRFFPRDQFVITYALGEPPE
jgi:hypothetical protein